MTVSLRTIATATLACALAVGLLTQTAVAQPAYATETSTSTSAADAGADGTGTDGTGADGTSADGTEVPGTDEPAESGSADKAAAEADATGDTSGTENAEGDASGDQGTETPGTTEKPAPNVEMTSEEAKLFSPLLDPDSRGNVTVPRAIAAASGLPSAGFKAGYILSDSNMYNGTSMSAAQIQALLNREVPRCTIGDPGRAPGSNWGNTTVASHCLKDVRVNTQSRAANSLCKAYAGAKGESAAQIIAKVGAACGISPKVLLVRLQLEQSLVTDDWPTVRQYSFAMGWNCPDSGPGNSANCNNGSAGFLDQVYGSAWQVKRYQAFPNDPNYRYKARQYNQIQWHPNKGCGTSNVYIENDATAALYIYTPYRPNQAALDAGWNASTNACATYGNRNFYQYYKAWFGSPNSYFPDVPQGHKFFTEIEWMGTSGLSSGTKMPDGRVLYLPRQNVTREAMAAFLYRLSEEKYTAPKTSPFADVPTNHKFYREIAWMHERGYSRGYADSTYKPAESISREAMAAFLYRFNDSKYAGMPTSPFADVKPGHKFYKEITWMRKTGLSYGNKQPSGQPKYAPYDRVTREAMAAFIYRMKH